jgi:chorismate mutase
VSVSDPVLHELREQISATDRAIVDAFNTRLELVAEIKAHKESRGIGFLDPERERSMLRDLTDSNRGPLSTEGLHELFATLLDLTKRELS